MTVVALLAVELGGGFGQAEARAQVVSPTLMQLELVVEAPAARSVVAHLLEPGGPDQTVAMAERSPGTYGAVVEARRADLVVVFEVVGGDLSEPVNLSRLGVDPAVLGRVPVAKTRPKDDRWLWLAVAAGAAALSLLAFWALGEEPVPPPDPGSDS